MRGIQAKRFRYIFKKVGFSKGQIRKLRHQYNRDTNFKKGFLEICVEAGIRNDR